MSFVLAFTAFIIICAAIYVTTGDLYNFWVVDRKLKYIPGPPGLPVIRNILDVYIPERNNKFCPFENFTLTCIIQNLFRWKEKYGELIKVNLFWCINCVMISEYDFIEFMLTSYNVFHKGLLYQFLHSWLGLGLLTSNGEKWKRSRKLLTPAFHFKIVQSYLQFIPPLTKIFINKLDEQVGKGAFDISKLTSLYTLDVICESAMGTKINAQTNSSSEYVQSVKELTRISVSRITTLKIFNIAYIFTKDFWKERKHLKVVHNYSRSIIKKRRETLIDLKSEEVAQREDQRVAFLDLLLQAHSNGTRLNDEEIQNEVDTFMFEGHDTVSSAINFTLYCLSTHPHIQDKVIAELQYIFRNDLHREATYEDLQNMKYLEMVIKESMRLYPPVPAILRTVHEDIIYQKHLFPKHTQFIVFALGVHMDPKNFPEPEKFDPERFSPGNLNKIKPFSYIPFSAGARNCIGQKFAILELKSALAEMLKNFQILPVEGYKPCLIDTLTLNSTNGVMIRIERRHFGGSQRETDTLRY